MEENQIKRIELTQGKFAMVDGEMFEMLNSYQWYAQRIRKKHWYAVRRMTTGPGTRKKRNSIKLWMHHIVAGFPLRNKVVDHRDGDGLNNCRKNLRHVTKRQNIQNCECHRSGTKPSKYVGVSWHKPLNKWRAQITLNGKRTSLGYFQDELDAATAYENALPFLDRHPTLFAVGGIQP